MFFQARIPVMAYEAKDWSFEIVSDKGEKIQRQGTVLNIRQIEPKWFAFRVTNKTDKKMLVTYKALFEDYNQITSISPYETKYTPALMYNPSVESTKTMQKRDSSLKEGNNRTVWWTKVGIHICGADTDRLYRMLHLTDAQTFHSEPTEYVDDIHLVPA